MTWRKFSWRSHQRRDRRRILYSCLGLILSASLVVTWWPFVRAAGQSTGPTLGALAPRAGDQSMAATGFGEVVIDASWSSLEPTKGGYSASAFRALQSQIDLATAAGLRASLDLGIQYAPGWVFRVGGGTHFVSQYGQAFGGSLGSGNDVPNAVTDLRVRTQMGRYISYLGAHLTDVSSVRLGGGRITNYVIPQGLGPTHTGFTTRTPKRLYPLASGVGSRARERRRRRGLFYMRTTRRL